MAEVELPYLLVDSDRHGTRRAYFRRRGVPRIRLRAAIGSPEFFAEYTAARDASEALLERRNQAPEPDAPRVGARPVPGTFKALAAGYLGSHEFRQMAAGSQTARRRVIESMWREPRKPGASELMGECPIALMTSQAIELLRDRKAGKPGAQRDRLKALSAMFRWGIRQAEWKALGVRSNPVRDVERVRHVTEGHHSWTDADVAKFEARWAIGTTPRLALALLLYTGQRRSDVVLFGRQHLRGEFICFTQQKNSNRAPVRLELPLLPELQRIIDASPTGELTFLVNGHGRAFTAAGFGMRFRRWCDEAGLKNCSAHGLRKAGATRAAEAGATEYQLCSIFGWRNPQQATVYIRAARQKTMANAAMHMLSRNK